MTNSLGSTNGDGNSCKRSDETYVILQQLDSLEMSERLKSERVYRVDCLPGIADFTSGLRQPARYFPSKRSITRERVGPPEFPCDERL